MTPETFLISPEKEFHLKAIALEISTAETSQIKVRLLAQMKILINQDNAIRLLMKGDMSGDPFELNLCQKLELRNMELALDKMDREQAIAMFNQALRISAVKSKIMKELGDKALEKKDNGNALLG